MAFITRNYDIGFSSDGCPQNLIVVRIRRVVHLCDVVDK